MPHIPQIETFRRDKIDDLDNAVNTFVAEQYAKTGHPPILKPFAGGCSVIYFVEAPSVPMREQVKFIPSTRPKIGPVAQSGPPNYWPHDLDHNRDRNRYGGRY